MLRRGTVTLAVAALLATTSTEASVVYDNGPIDGTIAGFTINNGFAVSSEFLLSAPAIINRVTFGAWTELGETITSIDWAITATPGTWPVQGTAAVTNGPSLGPGFGFGSYDVRQARFAIAPQSLPAGTYYLVLQNAVTGSGANAFWDINSVGLGGQQALSGTFFQDTQPVSFQLLQAAGGVPEPASWALLIAGFGLTGAMIRRRRALTA